MERRTAGAILLLIVVTWLMSACSPGQPECDTADRLRDQGNLEQAALQYSRAAGARAEGCGADGLQQVNELQGKARDDVRRAVTAEQGGDSATALSAYQAAHEVDHGNADAV